MVMHTASPFWEHVSDPQKELVDPAVQGTRNVLTSARDARVKRVVLTSSVAAVTPTQPQPQHHSKVFSEDDWQQDATLQDATYRLSKGRQRRPRGTFWILNGKSGRGRPCLA